MASTKVVIYSLTLRFALSCLLLHENRSLTNWLFLQEMSTATTRPPLSTHRSSITGSTNPLAATRLPSHSRNNSHSHSALSGALNAAHRVHRRKSITNSGANVAAVAAALTEAGDKMTPLPMTINGRRGTSTVPKSAVPRSSVAGSLPSPPASLPTHKFGMTGKPEEQGSAIDDDSNEMSAEEGEDGIQKARVRRASDGQPLTKDGKKSNRIELHCEKCGKTYKHSSCLTKHLFVPIFFPTLLSPSSLVAAAG